MPGDLVSGIKAFFLLAGGSLAVFSRDRERANSLVSSLRMEILPALNLNFFLIPNTVALGVRASTYEFAGGHSSVHNTCHDRTHVLWSWEAASQSQPPG